MEPRQASPGSTVAATPSPEPETEKVARNLDLRELAPVFVSATHFETEDLHKFEEDLAQRGATLTYDINEAKIILSKVGKKVRIQFDLRAKGLWTEEVSDLPTESPSSPPATKKRKLGSSPGNDASQAIVIDDESSTEDEASVKGKQNLAAKKSPHQKGELVTVVRVDWIERCKEACSILPTADFISYQGYKIEKPKPDESHKALSWSKRIASKDSTPSKPKAATLILERAKEDASQSPSSKTDHYGKRKFGHHQPASSSSTWAAGHNAKKTKAQLLQETTSNDEGSSSDTPSVPEWVKSGLLYACQRSTPKISPNDGFIALLKKIKLARLLTNDEIGVRAYSTSIASLAAYPHKLRSAHDVLRLPGCEAKIANLFVEYANTGKLQAVEALESDAELKVLRLFYDIWGVGANTAREFYFDKGWTELDDVVEHGWSTLSRVQQIGVKYYDEFLDPIPRAEVEAIGKIIHSHAVRVRDDKMQTLLVGGYRRGKEACGDVDIIVSHPDEDQTKGLVTDIVASLEDEGWITHTLTLSLNNTKRGQQTLPFNVKHGGHGFDTLDKALVVWQDPSWPTQERDLAGDPKAKNPNIHRRVDIIVAPWRTVGCAVVGWSGGTTFERDLRRYVKNVLGYKFDSSGVRNRANGEVVDVERYNGVKRAVTMLEAEKRVFDGLGLTYREPEERCTG